MHACIGSVAWWCEPRELTFASRSRRPSRVAVRAALDATRLLARPLASPAPPSRPPCAPLAPSEAGIAASAAVAAAVAAARASFVLERKCFGRRKTQSKILYDQTLSARTCTCGAGGRRGVGHACGGARTICGGARTIYGQRMARARAPCVRSVARARSQLGASRPGSPGCESRR